ncbi:hypothetical protein EON65_33880 [archaeon]|nr:MAG: hypothetical protein EON65_33880 [archaeon]
MSEKNRQLGQELDRVFMQRKQREQEVQQLEEQMDNIHRQVQKRINELDPNRLRAYNELSMRQKDLQDRVLHSETRLSQINSQIRSYEQDDKNNAIRKEYMALGMYLSSYICMCMYVYVRFYIPVYIMCMDPNHSHLTII